MIAIQGWEIVAPAIIEILIIFAGFYLLLRFLQGTRGFGILRGLIFFMILILVIMLFSVREFKLARIQYLVGQQRLLPFLVLILVLFQPEFRRVLIRLGEASFLQWFFRSEPLVISEIVKAADRLARAKIGGLIAIEQEVGLGAIIEGGVRLDARVNSDLIVNVFHPNTPLHDGAIVVRGNRIAAAGCLFPLTESPDLGRALGTRHRAAIGITEESDAIAIVISEERGEISLAYRAALSRNLDKDQLARSLNELLSESAREQAD